jgi:hypothetical protein
MMITTSHLDGGQGQLTKVISLLLQKGDSKLTFRNDGNLRAPEGLPFGEQRTPIEGRERGTF